MVSGLNQNVEILGRVFHVQTEVIAGDDSKIQTTVFLEGKVIGSREMPLEANPDSEERVRSQRDQQHVTIVNSLVARMTRLRERRASPDARPISEPEPAEATAEPTLPYADDDPTLLCAIRVRRLLGRFRDAIDVAPPTNPGELSERLSKATRVINNIVSSLTFREIRLDEQVRFNILKQRIDGWLSSDREHDEGVRIWSEVAVFSAYIAKINDREELIAFDMQLLVWGMHIIRQHGVNGETARQLQSLYGLDVRLDHLLDTPSERDHSEGWLKTMQDLLDRLSKSE